MANRNDPYRGQNYGYDGYDGYDDYDEDFDEYDDDYDGDVNQSPYGAAGSQGYYQEPSPGYGPNGTRNPGYPGAQGPGYGGYPEDDYNESYRAPRKPSMAARAAGKANTDPYSRSRQSASARQAHQRAQRNAQINAQRTQQYAGYDYDTYQPRRRRKKRHGFRNFLLFLLLLAAILGALYVLLFQAPAQSTDYYHTRKADFYNILVCATDEEELRTDTMMIATLDLKNGTVCLTSLPRDTIVDNGEWVPKLNGVYGLAGGGEAGAESLMNTVQTILGFRPDGYAIINYEVFRDAVDAMGGVTFDVPMAMDVDNPPNYDEIIHLEPGEQKLSGDQALAVCRYRDGYMMADIQRQYVQQSFLKAMIRQALSPAKWIRLPAVYRAVMDNTLTDLSDANLRYLALRVLLSGADDIPQNTLPGEGVDYNGASCYGLYGQSVVDLVNEVMNPYEEEITIDDVYILTVYDGYLVESTWRGEAFDASTYQYD